MSGGHFNYDNEDIAYKMSGKWQDEELNELFFDLFGGGCGGYRSPLTGRERKCEFGVRGGGLAESLDFWLSGDTTEESYREDVRRFKLKWLTRKTPKNRVEFYQRQFERYAREMMEKFRDELGE